MRSIVALFVIALTGCAFQYHGNYCGPGYPRNHASPAVYDDLDAICQEHDLCYDANREPKAACDVAMARALLSLSLNPACTNTAKEMALYFAGLHPSTGGDLLATASALDEKMRSWPLTAAAIVERGLLTLTDGRAGKVRRCCDRRVVPAPENPCYPNSATPLQLRIMQALTEFHTIDGLYYESEIPPRVELRARRIAAVPASETTIIAIVRSPGDALVFTPSGLYVGQLIGGTDFFTYPQLAAAPLQVIDDDTTQIGTRRFRFIDWPPGALYGIVRVAREAAVEESISTPSDESLSGPALPAKLVRCMCLLQSSGWTQASSCEPATTCKSPPAALPAQRASVL